MLLSFGPPEIEPSLNYCHASADNISMDSISVESALVIEEIISDMVRRILLILTYSFPSPDSIKSRAV